jgi:hypothetical protein
MWPAREAWCVSGRTWPTPRQPYVQSIRAVIDVMGIDHVGIGTDTKLTPARGGGRGAGRIGERTNEAWQGQEVGSCYAVVDAMLKAGFNRDEITNVGGSNFLRVFGGHDLEALNQIRSQQDVRSPDSERHSPGASLRRDPITQIRQLRKRLDVMCFRQSRALFLLVGEWRNRWRRGWKRDIRAAQPSKTARTSALRVVET